MTGRPLTVALAALVPLLGAAVAHADAPARAQYNLRQLVSLARDAYPGVHAARHALQAMEQQVYRARWAWLPQGTVTGFVAPSPEVRCQPDRDDCRYTAQVDASSINIAGVMAQIVLEAGMPLYTFDKIGSARRAARAGVELRRAQVRAAQEDVALKISEAYWGVKLARELLYTIREGKKHLDKARDKIEQQLDDDEGEVTVTDLLRLKTFTAEVEAREGEAQKLEDIAIAGVAALARLKHGAFDLDPKPLDLVAGDPAPLQVYVDLARQSRPEIDLLKWAQRAGQAGADVEKAKFFPDFLLVGTVGYGIATSVDDPHNAFLSDPFNFIRAGFGLALKWNLDTIQQVGRYRAAKSKSLEISAKREEGLAGIELEIRKEWLSLQEAARRLAATRRGEKAARSWLVATAQNLEAGLAESKDLTDALLAFFQLRVRYLQAIFDVNVGWARLGRAIGKKAPPRS